MEFKSIDDLSKKIAVQGTEKIPVSSTEYVDTEQIKEYISEENYSYTPTISYGNRVLADSGVINDISALTKLYVENLKLLDNTVFLWDGSAGIKTRTSGVNQYATKLYDMSAGNKDAVQSTGANQPFVGGGIAPNESKSLKCADGTTKHIAHEKISFADGQEWAVTFALNYTGHSTEDNKIICSGDAGWLAWRLKYSLYFRNSAGTISTSPSLFDLYKLFGKTAIHTVQATGGNVYWYINNKLWYTFTGINTAFSFQNIFHTAISANTSINGTISHYQIFNKALSASEIQAQYAYLRLQYPEIEGIDIGNQHWATSNYEGVVTGNGTVIPEVQDNAAWAALTAPAWCYYNNDKLNGAVYGKEYNGYAVGVISANPPQGWRVATQADWTQLATYLGGTSVAGGKLKKEGLTYWNSPNTGATNESGFSAIGTGWRLDTDGSFSSIKGQNRLWTANSGVMAWLNNVDATLQIVSGQDLKRGYPIRLIRNEPVGATERNIETGYITNALGATNLDISIPFGYQVESIRFDSETNITGLSAKLLTGALVELETLFTAKSVTANVQKVIAADADQSIQQTDAVVRINGTKSNTASRFRVWVKLTKVVFS